MNKAAHLCLGLALGAAAMYVFDPIQGRRRRAMLRDKAASAVNQSGKALARFGRDAAHRMQGLAHDVRHSFDRGIPSDDILVARVRSAVGRIVSHPHALEVKAHDGRVELGGHILEQELPALLERVRSVPGVREVLDHLQRHGEVMTFPAAYLQRALPSPFARLGSLILGGIVTAYGLKRRSWLGLTVGGVGLSLLQQGLRTRAFRSPVVRRAVGI